MPSAVGNDLRERVALDKRGTTPDIYGNVNNAFVEQFTIAARIRPLKGGEGVQAARLTGTQPVLISVRYSSQTKLIQSDWRARNTRTGTVFSIKTAVNTDERKQFIDMMAVAGEAA
ncbi:MAG: phage head closure protein [Pyrinomonadaceae bacterium]|nr:phage head closure protein [Pyrinomonadaceae bacterium]